MPPLCASETLTQRRIRRVDTGFPHSKSSVNGAIDSCTELVHCLSVYLISARLYQSVYQKYGLLAPLHCYILLYLLAFFLSCFHSLESPSHDSCDYPLGLWKLCLIFTRQYVKTTCLLHTAVCLNSLPKRLLVCKAKLEPSSAAETLQLELHSPLCSVPPQSLSFSLSLHVDTDAVVFTLLQYLHSCLYVCMSGWTRDFIWSLLSAVIPYLVMTSRSECVSSPFYTETVQYQ